MTAVITPGNNYSTQNLVLFQNLMGYYNSPEENNCLDLIQKIISGETRISLRIIDWFVTNYAKKYDTQYVVSGRRDKFKVYIQYKLMLNAYSKRRFDPFCRWDRIPFPYKEGSVVETTLGQLNFFKWALENSVIEYIEEHYADIERDMIERNTSSRRKESATADENAPKTRKKREELSCSASKLVKREPVDIDIIF